MHYVVILDYANQHHASVCMKQNKKKKKKVDWVLKYHTLLRIMSLFSYMIYFAQVLSVVVALADWESGSDGS